MATPREFPVNHRVRVVNTADQTQRNKIGINKLKKDKGLENSFGEIADGQVKISLLLEEGKIPSPAKAPVKPRNEDMQI